MRGDPLADIFRRVLPPQVGGSPPRCYRGGNRSLHTLRKVRTTKVVEHERNATNRPNGVRGSRARDVRGRSVHGLEQRVPSWMDIGRRSETQPARHFCGEIAQDITEEIRRYDDFVALRSPDQIHDHGIDIHRVLVYVRIAGAHFREDATPKTARMPLDVGLVHQGHATTPTGVRELEGRPDDPLHPLSRVDVFLDRDLVRCSRLEATPHTLIGTLSVLADARQTQRADTAAASSC